MEGEPIRRIAKFYRQGVVCAAEMWYAMFDTLAAESAFQVLNALAAEDQETLRRSYQPHYLELCKEEGVRLEIVRWLSISK